MPVTSPDPQSTDDKLPLLGVPDTARCVAWRDGVGVSAGEFLAHVDQVARQLPDGAHVVNLCRDRYAFLVAFCAVLVRGQSNLLPPSHAPQDVADIAARYADCYSLGEQAPSSAAVQHVDMPPLARNARATEIPRIATDHVAAIGHTSGSTGTPQASVKTWGSYAASTAGNLTALHSYLAEPFNLLATVPPQHMYGMEMSVLLPLLANAGIHVAQPLLPADIAHALRELPHPRVLVTTPVHLRALLASAQPMPSVAAMVSATAPMSGELAREAESRLGGPLVEVFGSTETCVFASRRSALDADWQPYPGVSLTPQAEGTRIEAPQLPAPVTLADIIEFSEAGCFRLVGRAGDLLEMAGKRASLGDLTQRLLAVEGVEDAVLFQQDNPDSLGVRRLAALVVAPGCSEADVTAALRSRLDPVFLPRPLRKVERLPRNGTGKLPRAALLAALADS